MRLPVSGRAASILLALLLAACTDAPENVSGIPDGAANGLYPQIVVTGSRSANPELRLALLRKPEGVRLGSYQGELSYDAAVLTFVAADLPEGVDGVAQLVAPGRIRFVGTALDGVGEAPLLSLRFARTGELKAEGFSVAFEDVSASEDLSDLTGTVYGGPAIVAIR
jgi:hypothetical protein